MVVRDRTHNLKKCNTEARIALQYNNKNAILLLLYKHLYKSTVLTLSREIERGVKSLQVFFNNNQRHLSLRLIRKHLCNN